MGLEQYLAEYIVVGSLGFVPVLALVLARRSLGVLNATSWLVVWGSLTVAAEHTLWAIVGATQLPAGSHIRFHFFMAGVYTAVGAVLLSVIARTLLRKGQRTGWLAVLFALLVGGGIDLVMVVLWFPHGVLPPVSRPAGIFLYSYHAAWLTALLISYKPVFGGESPVLV